MFPGPDGFSITLPFARITPSLNDSGSWIVGRAKNQKSDSGFSELHEGEIFRVAIMRRPFPE